jgi:hypothetical protein
MTISPEAGTGNPLEKLEAAANPNLRFPMNPIDYGTDDHALIFRVMRYDKANRKVSSSTPTVATIRLPVPANVTAAYNANHGDVELGAIANTLIDDPNVGNALKQALAGDGGGAADSLAKTDIMGALKGSMPKLVSNIVQSVGDSVGIKAHEAASISAGMAVNPHLASLFQGVGFRTHSFSYDFIAKTPQESKALKDIIYVCKYAMHPGLAHGGNTFTFPYQWGLQFSDNIRPYLYDFTNCVMTGFSASFNGQGIPTFFERTKAPVNVKIEMSFKEIEIITREKIMSESREQGLVYTSEQQQVARDRAITKQINENNAAGNRAIAADAEASGA